MAEKNEEVEAIIRGLFGEEVDQAKKNLSDLEVLEKLLRAHFDPMVRSSARGGAPLDFVARQAENLISIIAQKSAINKELVSIKKVGVDIDLKIKAMQHKLGSANTASALLQYYRELMNMKEKAMEGSQNYTIAMGGGLLHADDEKIDAVLEATLAELGEDDDDGIIDVEIFEVTDDDGTESEEDSEVFTVVTPDGTPYAVNSNYEPQDGYDYEDYTFEVYENEEGFLYAMDQNGDEYPVFDLFPEEETTDDEEQ
jgi:hypothetical protein